MNLTGLTEFNLSTLDQLDGGIVAELFRQALQRAALDCADRPATNKPRVVTLECLVSPQADERGDLTGVELDFQVKDKTPMRKSKSHHAFIDSRGRVLFNPNSPENAGQRTIFDAENEERASVPIAEAGA